MNPTMKRLGVLLALAALLAAGWFTSLGDPVRDVYDRNRIVKDAERYVAGLQRAVSQSSVRASSVTAASAHDEAARRVRIRSTVARLAALHQDELVATRRAQGPQVDVVRLIRGNQAVCVYLGETATMSHVRRPGQRVEWTRYVHGSTQVATVSSGVVADPDGGITDCSIVAPAS